MLLATFTGIAMVISVATTPDIDPGAPTALSTQQKNAAVQSLVRSATDCITQTVTADPRFHTQTDLGDLIVDSMPACLGPVRAMIDAYDRYFGQGSGEAFFMGPYLEVLPKAVTRGTTDRTP